MGVLSMIGDTARCLNCGTEFETRRKVHRFHTAACRYEYWIRTHPRLEIGKAFRLEVTEDGRLEITPEDQTGR